MVTVSNLQGVDGHWGYHICNIQIMFTIALESILSHLETIIL